MPDKLSEKKCLACEGDVTPLTRQQAELFLTQISEWQLNDAANAITRRLKFKGHLSMINFLNALAYISQQQNHHPDVSYSFNSCCVTYNTHAINGLSENDFICAAKLDQLLQ